MNDDELMKLQSTIAELNTMADHASRKIKAVEEVLRKLNTGIEVVLEEKFDNDFRLGFLKVESAWHVCVVGDKTDVGQDVWEALATPRNVRIAAARYLDALLQQILSTATAHLTAAKQGAINDSKPSTRNPGAAD